MGSIWQSRGDILKNTIDIKRTIEKFDHNARDLPNSIGVAHSETLIETVYDWMQQYDTHSKVFEIILNHETLNGNEKLFCIMLIGQVLSIHGIMQMVEEK